jgi:hypothetical protein
MTQDTSFAERLRAALDSGRVQTSRMVVPTPPVEAPRVEGRTPQDKGEEFALRLRTALAKAR